MNPSLDCGYCDDDFDFIALGKAQLEQSNGVEKQVRIRD